MALFPPNFPPSVWYCVCLLHVTSTFSNPAIMSYSINLSTQKQMPSFCFYYWIGEHCQVSSSRSPSADVRWLTLIVIIVRSLCGATPLWAPSPAVLYLLSSIPVSRRGSLALETQCRRLCRIVVWTGMICNVHRKENVSTADYHTPDHTH